MDSDDEEPVGTSNKISQGGNEGVKVVSSKNSNPSASIETNQYRKKEAKTQDVSSSSKRSSLVQNGKLPKKQKPDISTSIDRSKASVPVEPTLMRNKNLTNIKFGELSSPPKQRPLVINGRPQNKQELDISGSFGAESQEIDSRSDREESDDEIQSETSSNTGRSSGRQSETSSSSIGRNNESRAQSAPNNSVLCASMQLYMIDHID